MKMDANGIEINVIIKGDASPALVFLHYWGGSSRTWDEVIEALPATYLTVAPDLRGWGDSDAPLTGYALADFADDVQQLVINLALRDYVLVGHSMGGKIAQVLASRRPSGLKGVVLVATMPTPLMLPPAARSAMQAAYLSRESVSVALDNMLTAKPLSAAQRERVIVDSMRGAPQARDAWPTSTSLEDISTLVSSIDVPVAVIAGELDRVDGLPDVKQQLLSRISQAQLHVLPGVGHLSPLESPAEVADVIVRFIQSLKGSF